MKTNTFTTSLITLVVFLITFSLNATVFDFDNEDYIDDIPFDTEKIYQEILIENNDGLYLLDDEAYVDDIPFNTSSVANQAEYFVAVSVEFALNDEEYINDIPFNTDKITTEVNYHLAVTNDYNYNEESYIDDIPFDTHEVVQSANEESLGGQFLIAAGNSILF